MEPLSMCRIQILRSNLKKVNLRPIGVQYRGCVGMNSQNVTKQALMVSLFRDAIIASFTTKCDPNMRLNGNEFVRMGTNMNEFILVGIP